MKPQTPVQTYQSNTTAPTLHVPKHCLYPSTASFQVSTLSKNLPCQQCPCASTSSVLAPPCQITEPTSVFKRCPSSNIAPPSQSPIICPHSSTEAVLPQPAQGLVLQAHQFCSPRSQSVPVKAPWLKQVLSSIFGCVHDGSIQLCCQGLP
jgi:hypothetical protein